MCGICGFTNPQPTDEPILKAMCDVMAHRGPDGEGRHIDDGIALGHRRLSLIDLDGGAQPMLRDEWAIVFNGEIYNYRELRAELESQGRSFATNSDTEVLLVGFITWGEAVLQKLRGMFAFAIWNAETRELFCARDFFGIKPFYYTLAAPTVATPSSSPALATSAAAASAPAGATSFPAPAPDSCSADAPSPARHSERSAKRGVEESPRSGSSAPIPQFIFASEIKSILEHPAYHRELNEDALAAYLCFQFSPLQETFFRGIFKLPQGHCLRVRADGVVEITRYWRPEYRFDDQRPESETVDAIESALRESVRFHNVADVEVGSFLSSGIDSSYLAALLAQENPDIKTFTVGFSEYEGERDEVSWARELAGQLDIANDHKHITEEEYWEALPKVQWHMDEPSADPSAVALYFVDQLAARKVKAVLSGEGADEFFGGYRIYQAPLANRKLAWAPHGALRAGSKALEKLHLRGAHYLERASEPVEEWYYTNANDVAFSPEERDRVMSDALRERLAATTHPGGAPLAIGLGPQTIAASKPSGLEGDRDLVASYGAPFAPQELTAPVYGEVAGHDEVTRMQYVDLWFWLVGDILLKTDKMAMAHSLESRVPFLDREVFRISATIPTAQKVMHDQTKVTLRQAAERTIPRDWAQKEKLGFPVPVAAWLREERYYEKVKSAFTSETAARYFKTDELVSLLDAHRSNERDNTRRIWIVYSFLLWHSIYFE